MDTTYDGDGYDDRDDYGYSEDSSADGDDRTEFADPGGESSLYAATRTNPRNIACPTCGEPDRLTPRDVQAHHCCDLCARRNEMGF